jgi:nucleotide-binding universal stress UspA family protein
MYKELFLKILLPTDGSKHSLEAAEYAVNLALKQNAEVTIMHVYQPLIVPLSDLSSFEAYPYVESEEEAMERSQKLIEETKKVFDEKSIPVETKLVCGHVVHAIIEIADKERFNLIIIGSRGLGPLKRLFLGSVADGVLHHAHCPVLIIR